MSKSGSSRTALVFLVLTFGMLWIPVGQHTFLNAHWMKVGTFAAPWLLFVATLRDDRPRMLEDPVMLSAWMLVAYIAHQFEEHWIDVFGNVYAFHGTVNGLLMGVFGAPKEPLSPAGIFVINTSLVWLVGSIALWRSPQQVFPALAMAGIIVVNALSHIGVGVANGAYNAGLLTSIAVFLPLGSFVYVQALRNGWADRQQVTVSLVWAVLAHVVMVGGLVGGAIYRAWSSGSGSSARYSPT